LGLALGEAEMDGLALVDAEGLALGEREGDRDGDLEGVTLAEANAEGLALGERDGDLEGVTLADGDGPTTSHSADWIVKPSGEVPRKISTHIGMGSTMWTEQRRRKSVGNPTPPTEECRKKNNASIHIPEQDATNWGLPAASQRYTSCPSQNAEPGNRFAHGPMGLALGETEIEGLALADTDGLALGEREGEREAELEGLVLGERDGDLDGEMLADADGLALGERDGDLEGETLADADGLALGERDGDLEGETLADPDGLALGDRTDGGVPTASHSTDWIVKPGGLMPWKISVHSGIGSAIWTAWIHQKLVSTRTEQAHGTC
jgi:hypothetical protein